VFSLTLRTANLYVLRIRRDDDVADIGLITVACPTLEREARDTNTE